MGKRTRKAKSGPQGDAESGMTKALRKDTMDIVNLLLEKCSNPFGGKGSKEWDEYLEVYKLVEKLRKKQQNYVLPHSDRETAFPGFLTWLQQNGVSTDAVTVEKFDVGDYGVKANREIKESEPFLTIPYKVMITSLTAKSSVLGPLIKGDRMLQAMPNVALSLHVLCERATPSSQWAPYIRILPHTYSTPLYFTADEMELLKGSPAASEAINQFRNISRQYAYFFKQFQALDDVLKIPIRNMCFDDYRWAVSTVMTRQNQIPNRKGEQNVLSLIPLYDMCNHDNGHITTDYDLKKDCSVCYSLRNFKKDEQVFIFYGERSNADLLIHNGFMFPENMYDKLNIKLGISKNDHLYAMKSEVLARLSLIPSRTFPLHAGSDPVDSTLVAYLRVFNMDQEGLEARLRGEKASQLVRQLRDFGLLVNVENEMKCWNFLETRVKLLLRAYPTTKQQDEELLSAPDKLTPHARMPVTLTLSEKVILENTAEFSRLQKTEVEGLVREHLESMNLGMNNLDKDDEADDLAGLSLNPAWEKPQGVQIEEIFDEEEPSKAGVVNGVEQPPKSETSQQPESSMPQAQQPTQQPATQKPATTEQSPVQQSAASPETSASPQQPKTQQPVVPKQQPAAQKPTIQQTPASPKVVTSASQQPVATQQPAPTQQPPTTVQPAVNKQATQQPPTTVQPEVHKQATQKPPTTVQPAVKQATQQPPTTVQPAAQKPTTQQTPASPKEVTSASQQPVATQQPAPTQQPPTTVQPAVNKQATQQPPTTVQPAVNKQATQKPPTTVQPAVKQATQQPPTTVQPAVNKQATQQPPTTVQPAVNKQATQQPPTTVQPAVNKQATQQPPTTVQPAVNKQATQQPPTTVQPAVNKQATQQPPPQPKPVTQNSEITEKS